MDRSGAFLSAGFASRSAAGARPLGPLPHLVRAGRPRSGGDGRPARAGTGEKRHSARAASHRPAIAAARRHRGSGERSALRHVQAGYRQGPDRGLRRRRTVADARQRRGTDRGWQGPARLRRVRGVLSTGAESGSGKRRRQSLPDSLVRESEPDRRRVEARRGLCIACAGRAARAPHVGTRFAPGRPLRRSHRRLHPDRRAREGLLHAGEDSRGYGLASRAQSGFARHFV